jgi:hypothetical protein
MADAVGVAHDGNLCALLDAADELLAAAGHDEVDEAVLVEQRLDVLTRLDRLDKFFRKARAREGVLDEAREEGRGVGRLLAWLEDGRVARLDGERGNVDDDLGPGLKDDEKDADRARYPVEVELGRELASVREKVGRTGQGDDVADAREERVELGGRLKGEAREEGRGELAGLNERGRGLCADGGQSAPPAPPSQAWKDGRTSRSFWLAARMSAWLASSACRILTSASSRSAAGISCEASKAARAACAMDRADDMVLGGEGGGGGGGRGGSGQRGGSLRPPLARVCLRR